VLVDESNVGSSVRTAGRGLDWLKLRDFLAGPNTGRDLIEMVVYAGLPPAIPIWQEERDKKNKFMHWLRSNGFMVVTKDGSPAEEGHYKANVDVMMAIDALELSIEMRPDVVILVTGDADFAYLAIKLRRHGIRVEVASVAANLGNVLKSAANEVIDLGHLVSFTGIVTFKNGSAVRDVAAQLPLFKFMVETDCPYLAPVPFRGKRCEPAHTRIVAETIATARGISLKDVAEMTTQTAEEFFRFNR